MLTISTKLDETINPKLLGLEANTQKVEFKPKGVDMEYKLERQTMKSLRNMQEGEDSGSAVRSVKRF